MNKRYYAAGLLAALGSVVLIGCGTGQTGMGSTDKTEGMASELSGSAMSGSAMSGSAMSAEKVAGAGEMASMGTGSSEKEVEESADAQTDASVQNIDQETAKKMMEKDDGHIILDVRTKEEYAAGHIPGAINLPNEDIQDQKPEVLPDTDQIILIYCRSGHRAGLAAEKLAKLGYKKLYNFGGVNTWTGELVK